MIEFMMFAACSVWVLIGLYGILRGLNQLKSPSTYTEPRNTTYILIGPDQLAIGFLTGRIDTAYSPERDNYQAWVIDRGGKIYVPSRPQLPPAPSARENNVAPLRPELRLVKQKRFEGNQYIATIELTMPVKVMGKYIPRDPGDRPSFASGGTPPMPAHLDDMRLMLMDIDITEAFEDSELAAAEEAACEMYREASIT